MKKTFIAAALVGTILLTGCSGVSQEEYNSILSENESLKSDKSQIENQNSSLKSGEYSSTNSSAVTINSQKEDLSNTNPAAKEDFLNTINDLLGLYDSSKELFKQNDEDCFSANYLCSFNDHRDFDDYNAFIMFSTEDENKICDKIVKEAKRLNDYYDEYGTWYTIYINDINNNHIITISNNDVSLSGKKLSLQLCWNDTGMQNKYKKIESNEIFKDYMIKVIH